MTCSLRSLFNTFAALLLALFIGVAPAAAEKCEAASFVRNAGEAYDRAASAGSAAAFAKAAERYSDLRSLSLFALGRYRKELPKSREAEYLRLTRRFIGQTLKDHGSGFRGATLKIVECKKSGGNLVVTARTSGGTKVVFRLARRDGGYTVMDLNMRGVWLVQQMRSTFVGTINRAGSIDALFDYLAS
ncbi:ABC transporter substrate-binding protein [Aestuariivirga sp.]|uniref:ABC transporter substrate-binding protein n=1 Tax=Aestuariivirga sp. TaxID=2650926 RepID=UPI003919C4D2